MTKYGQQSTLSVPNSALHINIEDQITKYPDWQFPLLKRLNSKIFKAEVKSHKYEWTEKELRPVTAKVASATVASGATQFYVDTPGVFNVDDVLMKPAGQQVIVTAVAGGTLLTVKALAGTPESMVLGETVKRIGVATAQGKDADNGVKIGSADLFNYTQIFEDVVELTGTERNAIIHGEESSAEQISDKQKELMEVLQSTLFIGQRTIDQAEKRTTLGGLKFMLDTYAPNNVIDFGGSGTWATAAGVKGKLDDAVEKIANQMGGKPVIYLGYKAMRKIKDLADGTVFVKTTDKSRGTALPETYLSQLGELELVMIRERAGILDDLIFLVDEEQIGYKAMRNRGWFTEELAKTGDSYKWQVLGEYTMKVSTPKVHAYIHNLGL